jgi:hypothetical protein
MMSELACQEEGTTGQALIIATINNDDMTQTCIVSV